MVATPTQEHLQFVDCVLTQLQSLHILDPSGLMTLNRKGGSVHEDGGVGESTGAMEGAAVDPTGAEVVTIGAEVGGSTGAMEGATVVAMGAEVVSTGAKVVTMGAGEGAGVSTTPPPLPI